MCGIVGIVKRAGCPVTPDEYWDFIQLLVAAESRGNQATGCIIVKESGEVVCMKSPGPAHVVASYVPYLSGTRAILGHTRMSTGGSPENNENNHPHETAVWALIHNGYVSSDIRTHKLKCDSQCDTEEIVRTFEFVSRTDSTCNTAEMFSKAFPHITGCWSLAFVHKPTGTVYLTSNGGSPLVCAYYENGMTFASEARYFSGLSIVKSASKIELLTTKLTAEDVSMVSNLFLFTPKDNTLHAIDENARMHYMLTYEEGANYRTTIVGLPRGRSWQDWDDEYSYGTDLFNEGHSSATKTSEEPTTTKVELNSDSKSSQTAISVLFEKMDNHFTELGITYNVDTRKVSVDPKFSSRAIKKFVTALVQKNPKMIGAPDTTKKYRLRKGMLRLSRHDADLLMEEATESLFDAVHSYIDIDAVEVPSWVWSIVDFDALMEAETVKALKKDLLKETPWYYLVLMCRYDIFFVGAGVSDTRGVFFDEEVTPYVDDLPFLVDEIEEQEDGYNETKNRAVGTKGMKDHTCPKCDMKVVLTKLVVGDSVDGPKRFYSCQYCHELFTEEDALLWEEEDPNLFAVGTPDNWYR